MTIYSKTHKKVEWLKTNRQLWEGINWGKISYHEFRFRRLELVEAMKAAALYSTSTAPCDVNVLRLIELAKQ